MYAVALSENAAPAFLFKTLSDPTRLRLLNLLACGETCVCELTDASAWCSLKYRVTLLT